MTPELVVLGNLVVDDVVYEDARCRFGQPGGAALYAALGAAVWGARVAVGSVIGRDYPTGILDRLSRAGIDLEAVERVDGPNMRSWLLYEGRRRQLVHRLDSPSHTDMSPGPRALPESWTPRVVHLAPMPLPVQADWLGILSDRRETLLSLDTFELIDHRSLDRCCRAFAGADLVFGSEDELLLEGALERPEASVAEIVRRAGGRLSRLVLKRGSLGGLVFDRSEERPIAWEARSERVVDTTGAGDAFAGGMLAGLARNEPLPVALERGVVSASFALEEEGASGLLDADPAAARARHAAWFSHSRAAGIGGGGR